MYGAIWRVLPGPAWLKAIEAMVLILAVVAVLFLWAFPALAPSPPFDQQTIEGVRHPTSDGRPGSWSLITTTASSTRSSVT